MTDQRRPTPKGWCPGALTPMMSGDGLILRVRPRLGRVTLAEVSGLADLAERFGNGHLDLTNRGNLQLRGIAEADHTAVVGGLAELGLLDPTPEIEKRRNILTQPFWSAGDRTERLGQTLLDALPDLPDLPAKFGFAIDDGPTPLLGKHSADIRLENTHDSGLVLRADGWPTGRAVSEAEAIPALIELVQWFAATRRSATRRMADHLVQTDLPPAWIGAAPATAGLPPQPGSAPQGWIIGAAFGDLPAAALADLMRRSSAKSLSTTPWRLILLNGAAPVETKEFVTETSDPLLTVSACVGAPFCAAATVETRILARRLAAFCPSGLHVSGCAKGCAHPRVAPVTLVGRAGGFDLVRNGAAWDEPETRALDPDILMRSEGKL